MAENTPLTQEQLEQFNIAMKNYCENGDDSMLSTLFNIFDRDGNGRISRTELRVTLSSVITEGISETEVDNILE